MLIHCEHLFQWKRGVPVEVIPMAYSPVMLAMRGLGLTPVLRMAKEKAVSAGSKFRVCLVRK